MVRRTLLRLPPAELVDRLEPPRLKEEEHLAELVWELSPEVEQLP